MVTSNHVCFFMPSNFVFSFPRTIGFSETWYSSNNTTCTNCAIKLILPSMISLFQDCFFSYHNFTNRLSLTNLVLTKSTLCSVREKIQFLPFLPWATTWLFLSASGVGQQFKLSKYFCQDIIQRNELKQLARKLLSVSSNLKTTRMLSSLYDLFYLYLIRIIFLTWVKSPDWIL